MFKSKFSKLFIILGVILFSLSISNCNQGSNSSSLSESFISENSSLPEEISSSTIVSIENSSSSEIIYESLTFEEKIEEIKKDYFAKFSVALDGRSIEDVYVEYYIGEYNGYTVLKLSYIGRRALTAIDVDYFDDITITYGDWGNPIFAWKEGQFYELPDLYKENVLSKDDIISIKQIYRDLRKENK